MPLCCLFAPLPHINNDGVVVISGTYEDLGVAGIFTGPDPVNDALVSVTFGMALPQNGNLNDIGAVAYWSDDGTVSRVFVRNADSTVLTVADSSGPFAGFLGPVINNSGSVAFSAELDNGEHGIFTGPNPSTDTIVDTSGPFAFVSSFGLVLNNRNTVAFSAELDNGEQGIFTGPNPSTDTIVDTSGPFAGIGFFDLNDEDDVVFSGGLDSGGSGIFTGPDPHRDIFVDSSGPFDGFSWVENNNNGDIAFTASLDDFASGGIYTGPNIETDKVIADGDQLFGSTVLVGGLLGLNDAGEVLFSYSLENGVSGWAVASPVPEPSSTVLLLTGHIASGAIRLKSTQAPRSATTARQFTLKVRT